MPTPAFHSAASAIAAWRQRTARIAHAMDANFTWLAACIMLFALCLQLASAGDLASGPPPKTAGAAAPQPAAAANTSSCSPQRDAALQSHFMLLHMCSVERVPRPGSEAGTPKRAGNAIKRRMT